MLTQEEIAKRLNDVDLKLCVVFSARCSLRVLPLLMDVEVKIPFSYWKADKRGNYLLN